MVFIKTPGSDLSAFKGTTFRIRSTTFLATNVEAPAHFVRRHVLLDVQVIREKPVPLHHLLRTTAFCQAPLLEFQNETSCMGAKRASGRRSGGGMAKHPANFSKYLCQKVMTMEVQIGALSQQLFTSSKVSTLDLPLESSAKETTARAAVVALQLAWFFRMSWSTIAIKSKRRLARKASGLCQISTTSW
eukprot:CAMPEP_0114642552 /NCGR_PEP_ID=MMETSP0191-20121206/2886_1 /TAXON_ID=126664 /ORGANISM="Sorites sp." /LENGTH=188 /DNA_ID=CAMNT_0001854737 /DNA_START=185 /DNA_END=749 /DNA_ORIENTATION=+